MENHSSVPMLFPVEPEKFWQQIRLVIREEIEKVTKDNPAGNNIYHTEGLTQKPLYKINEVCKLFDISRPTIYDWIKHVQLKPFKIRSRVYFLYNDIQQLLAG